MDVFDNAETIYLPEVLKIANYHVIDGNSFLWTCFGVNARFMDFYEDGEKHFSVIFDTLTQRVYQVMISDDRNNYMWTDPSYKQYYEDEAKSRNQDPYQVFDDLVYTVIEQAKDIKEKAYAIVNDLSYDERVKITVDLNDDLLLYHMLQAHELDVTFNEYVEQKMLEFVTETQEE